MSPNRLLILLCPVAASLLVVILAPWLGLGDRFDFILYRWIGLTRAATVSWLLLIGGGLVLYRLLITRPGKLMLIAVTAAACVELALLIVVSLAPYVGEQSVLGRDDLFIYGLIGVNREQAFFLLSRLTYGVLRWSLYGLLAFATWRLIRNDPALHQFGRDWKAVIRSTFASGREATALLFKSSDRKLNATDLAGATAVLVFCSLLFAIFLAKNFNALRDMPDTRAHQAFIDYDLNWGTPLFALTGNLLNHFDLQMPLNANLSPLFRLAHLAGLHFEVAAAQALFYVALAVLFWFLGRSIGLRHTPCAAFAGLTALIMTTPFGLDALFPWLPPFLFLTQPVLTRYWFDIGVLTLATALVFFWLGQGRSLAANIACAALFAALCFLVLLVHPAVALFSVPIIFLYCLTFLFTANAAGELRWKIGIGGMVAAAMFAAHIPTFFRNLYSFAFGSYFASDIANADPGPYLTNASMLMVFTYEPRVYFVFAAAFLTAGYAILRTSGALRRIALGVVVCEGGLLTLAVLNYFIFHYPISLYYAEQIHAPMIVALFVLPTIMVAALLFARIAAVVRGAPADAALAWAARNRIKVGGAVAAGILAYCVVGVSRQPAGGDTVFPAATPASFRLIEQSVALKPGGPFKGRVYPMAYFDPNADLSHNDRTAALEKLITAVYGLFQGHYGRVTGNDHWFDLLPFDIPIVNEYAHWSSPINFVFLRHFFGRKEDKFEKALFILRVYNERIARAAGISYVVTNVPSLPGTSMVSSTMTAGEPLNIFRVDDVNLGQYSPSNVLVAGSAADTLAALSAPGFDPKRDVVLESPIAGQLVPGKLISLTTEFGPVLSIEAESSGRSLLLLPFEYSNCLRLAVRGSGKARIVPANLQQIGFVFEGRVSATLSFLFGPLEQPNCRADDLLRADRIHLREALNAL